MKRNTLDLDFNGERAHQILLKVQRCPGLVSLEKRVSPSGNGYHVIMVCKRDCDVCRFVFDDAERFSRDLTRPVHTRDVLWDRKVYRKGTSQIVLCSG